MAEDADAVLTNEVMAWVGREPVIRCHQSLGKYRPFSVEDWSGARAEG